MAMFHYSSPSSILYSNVSNRIFTSKPCRTDRAFRATTSTEPRRTYSYKKHSARCRRGGTFAAYGVGRQQYEEHKDYQGHDEQAKMRIEAAIDHIKCSLNTIGDGRSNTSPYDTAWIALIPATAADDVITSSGGDHGGGLGPKFPSSLKWIVENQLSDGSWGEERIFSPYDRLLSTLACVIALKTWGVHSTKAERGVCYIKENMCSLESGKTENMTSGFEILFPALLDKARNLGIQLPYDSPALKEIYHRKALKMMRIPRELIHTVPTTALYSLEGLEDLDWERLLKFQTPLGSFLTSPSSTAFAFMETQDEKCLRILEEIVQKFDGGGIVFDVI